MLDITALLNALRDGSVSFVAALGAQPYLDDAGEVVRIRGEDALIVPLGRTGDRHPRYALRLPLEHDGGASWPARYADIAAAGGAVAGHLPAGVTILDVDEIRGTAVALLHNWVPGESLTARVTRARERHTRDRLAELLWPLADLADALRTSTLIHGDIAPGNIIVRPDGEMTLIDLDRAGYRDSVPPVEPRRRAGYRLPRTGGAPEDEDAFSLLVLMTSIAILADTSVPIDHERAPEWTHPALLFSSWDLMDPQRSRLVREIEDQLSPLTRELLDRLIGTCTGRPDHAQAMLREATRLIHRAGTRPAAGSGIVEVDDGWHLVERDGGPAEVSEPPGIDAGWPGASEPARARPEPGWPAMPDDAAPPRIPTWPEPAPDEPHGVPEPPVAGDRPIQAIVDRILAVSTPPLASGSARRQQRAERRRREVSERLQRALAENDRPVLVELAMSGALAELGESSRQDVLQVVRALAYDAIARAIATDDDEAILASIDRSIFAADDDIDPVFRDRVRLAAERSEWTDRVRAAARERDGHASAELMRTAPRDGLQRLPEAVRRQVTRLAEEEQLIEAAQQAIRQRDANTLAVSLGRLAALRPVWTERVDAAEVVRLLGIEQVEERLVGVLATGKLDDSDQWMVDLVIAAGRLPEVTRIARLTPREVDRMIHREVEP